MGQIIFYTRIGENYLPSPMNATSSIITLAISLAVVLAFYLLRSIGLYTLAKRNDVKHGWLSFIPAVWMYVATKLIKEQRFFGKTYEKFALWFAVIAGVTQTLSFIFYFFVYFPLFGYFFSGGTIYYGEITPEQINTLGLMEFWHGDFFVLESNFQYPYVNFLGMMKALNIIARISNVLDFVYLIVQVNVYFALFRKFWPNHYLLASIFSTFFGLFPIFAFIIRKKEPVNYRDYVRSRYQSYGPRYYGGSSNQYGNQNPYENGRYGNQNPYGNQNGQSNYGKADPFDEFGGNDEPFEEFDNRKNK